MSTKIKMFFKTASDNKMSEFINAAWIENGEVIDLFDYDNFHKTESIKLSSELNEIYEIKTAATLNEITEQQKVKAEALEKQKLELEKRIAQLEKQKTDQSNEINKQIEDIRKAVKENYENEKMVRELQKKENQLKIKAQRETALIEREMRKIQEKANKAEKDISKELEAEQERAAKGVELEMKIRDIPEQIGGALDENFQKYKSIINKNIGKIQNLSIDAIDQVTKGVSQGITEAEDAVFATAYKEVQRNLLSPIQDILKILGGNPEITYTTKLKMYISVLNIVKNPELFPNLDKKNKSRFFWIIYQIIYYNLDRMLHDLRKEIAKVHHVHMGPVARAILENPFTEIATNFFRKIITALKNKGKTQQEKLTLKNKWKTQQEKLMELQIGKVFNFDETDEDIQKDFMEQMIAYSSVVKTIKIAKEIKKEVEKNPKMGYPKGIISSIWIPILRKYSAVFNKEGFISTIDESAKKELQRMSKKDPNYYKQMGSQFFKGFVVPKAQTVVKALFDSKDKSQNVATLLAFEVAKSPIYQKIITKPKDMLVGATNKVVDSVKNIVGDIKIKSDVSKKIKDIEKIDFSKLSATALNFPEFLSKVKSFASLVKFNSEIDTKNTSVIVGNLYYLFNLITSSTSVAESILSSQIQNVFAYISIIANIILTDKKVLGNISEQSYNEVFKSEKRISNFQKIASEFSNAIKQITDYSNDFAEASKFFVEKSMPTFDSIISVMEDFISAYESQDIEATKSNLEKISKLFFDKQTQSFMKAFMPGTLDLKKGWFGAQKGKKILDSFQSQLNSYSYDGKLIKSMKNFAIISIAIVSDVDGMSKIAAIKKALNEFKSLINDLNNDVNDCIGFMQAVNSDLVNRLYNKFNFENVEKAMAIYFDVTQKLTSLSSTINEGMANKVTTAIAKIAQFVNDLYFKAKGEFGGIGVKLDQYPYYNEATRSVSELKKSLVS